MENLSFSYEKSLGVWRAQLSSTKCTIQVTTENVARFCVLGKLSASSQALQEIPNSNIVTDNYLVRINIPDYVLLVVECDAEPIMGNIESD